MANSIIDRPEEAALETREGLVAAIETEFAREAAVENMGRLMLYGIAWHALEGDETIYPSDPIKVGCMPFTRDKLVELAHKDPEYEPARDKFHEMTKTAYQKRRMNAFLSGHIRPSGSYNDEDFARGILSGEVTFEF